MRLGWGFDNNKKKNTVMEIMAIENTEEAHSTVKTRKTGDIFNQVGGRKGKVILRNHVMNDL